jgi:diguanylate cyclase (GGDEF)-like protein
MVQAGQVDVDRPEGAPVVTEEPSREDEAATGRHVSNVLLANLAAELREMGGNDLLDRVKARAGERRELGERGSVEEGAFLLGWSTLDETAALFDAAVEVTGDPDVPYRAGQWAFRGTISAGLVDGLRALGGPGELLGLIGPVAAKVTTVTDAEAVEIGATHGVVRYRTRAPHVRNRVLCEYTRGTLSSFPTVYDLGVGHVTEEACQTRGDAHCVYRVSWDPAAAGADPEARIAALEERLETLSVRYANLEQVSALLSASNDIDGVLASVVTLAGVAVSAPHHVFAVHLPGERSPRVHCIGIPAEQAGILARRLLAADDLAASGAWQGAVMAVDVASARRHYGRLAAFSAQGHQFMPNEDRLLAAYAGHAAAALEAAVAFEETRRLLNFSAQLAETATTAEMTERIAKAALSMAAAERSAVLLWERDDDLLVRSAVAQWSAGDDGTAREEVAPAPAGTLPDAASVDGEALEAWARTARARPQAAVGDPIFEPVRQVAGCEHAVVVPLVARSELLGLLVLDTGEAGSPVDDEVARRMSAVANLASSALHSARLLEVVQHQAHHDTLTGLPNMRLFEDRMNVALAACRRTGSGLAVLFVDLDGFKDVNDRLGHAVGDRVLCQVADRLSQAARASDSVARLGGDGFVVLVPNIGDRPEAERVIQRVAAAIESTPVLVPGDKVHLRASIGIARYPEDGGDPEELLHRADLSMYERKLSRSAGRS